jgi:hypothetical protein
LFKVKNLAVTSDISLKHSTFVSCVELPVL